MGADDLRLDRHGNIDFRLARQLRSYTKVDDAPHRVRPIPIQLLHVLVVAAYSAIRGDAGFMTIADMACLAFFFLMRPGGHTYSTTNTQFRYCDVKLFIGHRPIDTQRDPEHLLNRATHIQLVFTTQKNGVKGEIISQGTSGHSLTCPVKAGVRRLIYARRRHIPFTRPLCTYYDSRNIQRHVTSKNVTTALRSALNLLPEGSTDLRPQDIEARSLRAGGATALLNAGVTRDTIQLLGRWKSDAMLRYLHVQNLPTMNRFASLMFNRGSYDIPQGFFTPALPP